MGFDLNNNMDIKAENQSNASAIDYSSWLLVQNEPDQDKTPKFITMSMLLHASVILAIATMTFPLIEQPKTETITIELEQSATPRLMTKGSEVPATKGGSESMPAKKLSQADIDDLLPPVAAPQKNNYSQVRASLPTVKPVKKIPSAQTGKVSLSDSKNSGSSIAAKTNFKAVPMTIDDISAPELNQGALAEQNIKSDLSEDFNEDFNKIDHSHKSKIAKEKEKMDSLASALSSEQEDQLNSLSKQNETDLAKFSAAQKTLHQKNENAIASAVAKEKALGSGLGHSSGAGIGNQGASSAPGNALAGSPQGSVRSLDQLRQLPGNPRPQYDTIERRRGDQGSVAFFAYVSKEGFLSQFRMQRSTGFRNLDIKTLAALKKWRFYPGQEGWVELPFRWDIKGGVQEDGGRLRSKISQR